VESKSMMVIILIYIAFPNGLEKKVYTQIIREYHCIQKKQFIWFLRKDAMFMKFKLSFHYEK